MIAIDVIIEIIRLFYLTGWTYREIAAYLNVSHQTVSRYLARCDELGITWRKIKNKSPDEVLKMLGVGSQSRRASNKVHLDYDGIAKKLANRRKGDDKAKTYITEHTLKHGDKAVSPTTAYKGLRAAKKKLALSMTQIFEPGRALHIDFAGVTLELKNGLKFNFFVGVWAFSKLGFFRASTNQKQSSWFIGIDEFIRTYGVKPKFIVSDNATTLVKIKDGNRIITEGYQRLLRHHDIVADFIPAGQPLYNQPAEQWVKIFTEEVYPKLVQLDLANEDEINEVLQKMANEINHRPLSGRAESRLELFDKYEKPICEPSNQQQFEPLVTIRKVTIGKHYRFKHDGVYYSVPQECYWKQVTLEIHKHKIYVKLGNKTVWIHERKTKGSAHVILPDHMPYKHRVLIKQNKQFFVDWADKFDENLVAMVKAQYESKALSDTDFYARKQCREIQKLFDEYRAKGLGGEFVSMCFMCIESGRPHVTALKSLLADKVYENDDLIDAFDAFYVAKQANVSGGSVYVH